MKSWTRAAMMLAGASALVLGGLTPPAVADGGGGSRTVLIQDRCDPATFNAAFPPDPICAPHSGETVTFARFIATIQKDPAGVLADRAMRGWRFHDDHVTLNAGQGLVLKNTGGEVHSFTPVAVYGTACFPPGLQALFAGLGEPDACVGSVADGFHGTAIGPGQTSAPMVLPSGRTYRFECMIHPWMRADVTVL